MPNRRRLMLAVIVTLLVPVLVSDCKKDKGEPGPDTVELLPSHRRIDWDPGVPGGIPERTEICANVKEAPYNAAGDGVADDTAAIQAAIDDCFEGGVVFMPEGIYRTTGQIDMDRSSITLRGEGPDLTRIQSDASEAHRVISMGSGGSQNPTYIPVISGHNKGSDVLTLADASEFEVGDLLLIDQENDPDIVTSDGLGGSCTWCGTNRCSSDHSIASWRCGGHGDACDDGNGVCEGGKRSLGHMLTVTARDSDTIGVEPALYWEFEHAFEPMVLRYGTIGQYIGIEDLYITKIDPAAEGPTIYIASCAYCWLRNLELANTPQYHVQTTHIFRNEIRESYIHGAICYTGNHGYGITLQGYVTATLIENNVFEDLASPVSFSAAGGGNVVAYNFFGTNVAEFPTCGSFSYASKSDVTQHGAHPIFNLYEGNVMGRFGTDFYWGSASHQTAFRNRIRGFTHESKKYKNAVNLDSHARYYNIIGNIIGMEGIPYEYEVKDADQDYCWNFPYIYYLCYEDADTCLLEQCDLQVAETMVRHGNYDYASLDTVWDPEIDERTLPDSLYLPAMPSWWSQHLAWPPFGPDASTAANKTPAQERYEALSLDPTCGNGKIERRTIRVLVDSSEPSCTLAGSWQEESDSIYEFRNNYHTDGTPSSDPDTYATFSFTMASPGTYDVYFRWFREWNSPAEVPITVTDDNGMHDLIVDESQLPPEGGVLLGSFSFSNGGDGQVVVYASSEGVTTVDGLWLQKTVIEECDDGNTEDGDGCSSSCLLE